MRARSFHRGVALLAAAALFMENLDATIIQTAAPAIARDLGVAPVDVGFTIVAYLLAVAIFIPASGWLADRFGIRQIFLTSVAVFTIASALCAVAPTLELLTAARALQGIGGALMVPVGRLAVLRGTEPRDLLDAIAYLTWPALVAPVVAPAIGGFLADTIGWEWIFLLNIPLGVAAIVAGFLLLHPATGGPPPPRFDITGFTLIALALVALTSGAEMLGIGDWASFVWGLLALAATAVFSALSVRAMRRAAHPLLQLSPLRLASFRVGNVSGSVYRMMITAAPFLFTLQFQESFGWSAVAAGLAVAAVFAGNVGIKPFTTPIIRRWGFRTTLIASNAIGLVLFAVCATFTASTPMPVIVSVLMASGIFRSIGFSAYNTLQFSEISAAEMNNANTLSSTLQQVAATMGVAVAVLLVRLGTGASSAWFGDADPGYAWTYVAGAAVMVLPLAGAFRLSPDAGHQATR